MTEAPNFDRLAGAYRWMEYFSFGPWLWLTRRTFLDELGKRRRALVIGDGDGRFTARLLEVNRTVLVVAVDASGGMLRSLVRRAGGSRERVHGIRADARSWDPHEAELPFDLIATHFFLDCLTQAEVEALARKLRGSISADAAWVVSEFSRPSRGIGAVVSGPLISFLYWCFGWLTGMTVRTLPDYGAGLRAAGFRQEKCRQRLGGMLVAEWWVPT